MVENRIEVQTSLILRNDQRILHNDPPIPAQRPIHFDLRDPAHSETYSGERNDSQHQQIYALLHDAPSTSLWQLEHRPALPH